MCVLFHNCYVIKGMVGNDCIVLSSLRISYINLYLKCGKESSLVLKGWFHYVLGIFPLCSHLLIMEQCKQDILVHILNLLFCCMVSFVDSANHLHDILIHLKSTMMWKEMWIL